MNNKGGTGKTTVSMIVAHDFALRGKRVLALDLDPQCNFSRRFLEMEIDPIDNNIIRPPKHSGIDPNDPTEEAFEPDEGEDGTEHSANIFIHGGTLPYPTSHKNIHVIPGHSELLLSVERVTEQKLHSVVLHQVKDCFKDPYFSENYDVAVIDTGPSKGPLTSAALEAATDIIIPTKMEEMSVEGLIGMLAFWEKTNILRPANKKVNLIGVLANMVKGTSGMHKHYFKSLSEEPNLGQYMLTQILHDWQGYAEGLIKDAKPMLFNRRKDKCATEAKELCDHIYSQMFT